MGDNLFLFLRLLQFSFPTPFGDKKLNLAGVVKLMQRNGKLFAIFLDGG